MGTLKTNISGHLRNKINVSIKFSDDEIEVGKLILDNRKVYFKYNDKFLERGLNLSPIKLQFNNSIQFAKPEPFVIRYIQQQGARPVYDPDKGVVIGHGVALQQKDSKKIAAKQAIKAFKNMGFEK